MDAQQVAPSVSSRICFPESTTVLIEIIVLYNGLGSHIETVPKANLERFFQVHQLSNLLPPHFNTNLISPGWMGKPIDLHCQRDVHQIVHLGSVSALVFHQVDALWHICHGHGGYPLDCEHLGCCYPQLHPSAQVLGPIH